MLTMDTKAVVCNLANDRLFTQNKWRKQKMTHTIKRGEIYYADLNPVVGCEQGDRRPVLILQNDISNKHSPVTIVAAITSNRDKTYLPNDIEINPACL